MMGRSKTAPCGCRWLSEGISILILATGWFFGRKLMGWRGLATRRISPSGLVPSPGRQQGGLVPITVLAVAWFAMVAPPKSRAGNIKVD
jgi:hypothetical protein